MEIKRLAVYFGLVFTIIGLIATIAPFLWNYFGYGAKTIRLTENSD